MALIANKELTKGVSTGKLFLALSELRYISQEDKSIFMRSIKEFGKREINKDFSIGADNGMYRFITNDEKNHRKDIEELKKDLEKCCNEAGNMVESS